ncbi:hypothetical protein B0A50_05580 [Salinomyces thailandicus]|uniref:Methyltransferase type 11 domain-containing protein n=1 Tax=Salinomyces thailandicus TaxID=706561 RepID=A0A4U0TVG3_9PEZI|nr:hypothetical protein B0A50_05580 [Salinomyces thailandica]
MALTDGKTELAQQDQDELVYEHAAVSPSETHLEPAYSTERPSELEVVSKEMSDGLPRSADSGLAPPEDSPKTNGETQSSEDCMGAKSETAIVNGDGAGSASIDSIMSGTTDSEMGGLSPEDFSTDPMLASAIASTLHPQPNLDALFSSTTPARSRAPSILKSAQTVSDDWELYKRAGPRYPASIDRLIMKYHQKHSDSWQLAHDLGAGSGVYAPTLAKFFRHVHVSDPATSGLNASRQLLSAWSAENDKKRGRFTFSHTKPEEAAECVADKTVDLATLTECAHFTNPDAMVRSVAASLAPNGTLAMVTHRPIANVVGNQQVREAVARLYEAWGRKPWDVACGTDAKSRQQFGLGLDYVPLPEDLFKREETRRITINAGRKDHALFRAPFDASEDEEDLKMSADEMMDLPTSRVDAKEKRVEYSDDGEVGKGWRHEVGWESFRTRIAMFDSFETVQRLEPYLTDIQECIMKTSPNGVKVVIEWAVVVFLATKKEQQ